MCVLLKRTKAESEAQKEDVVLLKKQKHYSAKFETKYLYEHSRRSSGGGASYAAPRRGVVSVACDDVSCMVE